MEHYYSKDWASFLDNSLLELLKMNPINMKSIKPSDLPEKAGVYLIVENIQGVEIALYVGRTKNIKRRIYVNHIMGDKANARLKKYIYEDKNHLCYNNFKNAKLYLQENCQVKWILEDDFRKRGALEGYFTAKFFPKYGISIEH